MVKKVKSQAKSVKGLIQGLIAKFRNDEKFTPDILYSPKELQLIFEESLAKYDELQTKARVSLAGWKGKSSFEVVKKPDCFEVITFQKPDKDSKPHEVRTIITKEEVNQVLIGLQKLDKGKKIPTRKLGELIYQKDWDKEIFCDRQLHPKLTKILGMLDKFGFIKYRGGSSLVLNKNLDIQLVLK